MADASSIALGRDLMQREYIRIMGMIKHAQLNNPLAG